MPAGTRSIAVALTCFIVVGCAFAPDKPETDPTRVPASESAAENPDEASEIAARAVASVLDSAPDEHNSDLAVNAYDAVVRDLLLKIEAIEKEHGHVTRELEAPLLELGKLYASAEQCQNAIPMLRQAILLSQRLDGVMTPRQLPMYAPLLECFVSRDMLRELERAQEQMLLVHESEHGKDDVRMLPALRDAGAWYEQAGQYESARNVYTRAMTIARKAGGEQDVRLVKPLRSLARTYRLQAQYEEEAWRERAVDAQGQRLLERAAQIVRTSANASAALRIETLLEFGDWYQVAGAVRDAAKLYKEVWQAAVAAGGSGLEFFRRPEPLLYRAAVGVALRRAPQDRENLRHYWIDFEFTVTRLGEVDNVVVKNTGAPGDLQRAIAENLKRTHYRPRFVDGEAVDSEGIRIRQGVWVGE
jgi:tetratricopeptide (TPR) repeat protein